MTRDRRYRLRLRSGPVRTPCPPHDHVGQARRPRTGSAVGGGTVVVVPEQRFDAAYYRRFYGPKSVHDRRRIGRLVEGVLALAAWWHVPVRSVLDVGAGKGYWRDCLADERPSVRYHGIDVSEFACRRYGHDQADLATWRPSRTYDLVVCQSMLQYLDDRAGGGGDRLTRGGVPRVVVARSPDARRSNRSDRSRVDRPRRALENRRLVPQAPDPSLQADRRGSLALVTVTGRVLRLVSSPDLTGFPTMRASRARRR